MDISVSDAPAGRLIDGRYRIESMLAKGGMATVYRALDTRLNRTVALKIMHAELAADDEFVERFIREAHAAARLSDPNVVAVFDQGEDAGAVYLAMEFVDGQTMRQALREHGRLEVPVALEAIASVLSALSAAHKAGIVHRDVKPENVLISNDGQVKVADFGLARASSAPANDSGLLLGTVNYISPEQALGDTATARSDVYSAGILLYEMLTGTVPHSGPTDFVVVRSHIDEDVPPPSDLVPVPRAVDELVAIATSRDPEARFADAGRFLTSVRRADAAIDGYAVEPIAAVEPPESAGVTVNDAYAAAAPPPGPPPAPPKQDGASSHTRTISPAAASLDSPVRRADRRDRLDERRRAEATHGPNWRKTALLATVLVIALSVAIGAWWMGAGRWTSTPSLLNLTAQEAQTKASNNGLTAVEDGEEYSETVPEGHVVSTDPGPGERILDDGQITFVVSLGPERYAVPDLSGLTRAQAKDRLENEELTPDFREAFHDTIPKGNVIEQGTKAGKQVRRDTDIAVTISKGPEPLEIRDFTGAPAQEAQSQLEQLGFAVTVNQVPHPKVKPGIVISQDPSSGTGKKGDPITLTVSQGQDVPVPNVVGKTLGEARQILTEAGFKVDARTLFGGKPTDDMDVQQTQPAAGTVVKSGSKVTLIVLPRLRPGGP